MLLTVRSVGRVLDLFSAQHPERGVTEVARLLDISRSKAHALLASMAAIGLLRRVEGGRYRVGWRTLSLSRIVATTTPWHPPAVRAGTRLVREYGEAVHLATIEDGRVVYIDRLTGPDSLRLPVAATGSRLAAHCSGVGKVLLAGLPADEAGEALERHGLPSLTAATLTDARAMADTLAAVREQGYARDGDESVDGVSCVAAPLTGPDGRTVAALSISAPTHRLHPHEDELRRAVVGAARAASADLRMASAGEPS